MEAEESLTAPRRAARLLLPRLLLFALVAQAVLDLAALYFRRLGPAAQIGWVGQGVVLVVAAAVILVRDVVLGMPSLRYRIGMAGLVAASFALLAVYATLPSSISHEATQEVGCGLRFLEKPGLGFAQNCFLGYPVRQYFLPALPSLVAGRSQLALNVGGVLQFVLGVIVFSSGVLVTFRRTRFAHLAALVLVTLPLHLYYVNQFLLMFEQGLYPFSIGLLAAGFFLRARALASTADTYLCGIAVTFLAYSYTPALALVPLALLGLVLTFRRPEALPASRIGRVLLFLCVAIAVYVSLTTREDVRLTESGRPLATYLGDLVQGFATIFAHRNFPFSTWAFTIVLVGVLLAALFRKPGNLESLAAVWVLGVFAVAAVARGYWYYEVEFRVHRALVAVPVILLLLLAILQRQEQLLRRRAWVALVLAAVLVANGLAFHYYYLGKKLRYETTMHLNTREMARQLALVRHLRSLGFRGDDAGVFLIAPDSVPSFLPINDELAYFLPRLTMVRLTECNAGARPADERPVVGVLASSPQECSAMIEGLGARLRDRFVFQGTTAFVYSTAAAAGGGTSRD